MFTILKVIILFSFSLFIYRTVSNYEITLKSLRSLSKQGCLVNNRESLLLSYLPTEWSVGKSVFLNVAKAHLHQFCSRRNHPHFNQLFFFERKRTLLKSVRKSLETTNHFVLLFKIWILAIRDLVPLSRSFSITGALKFYEVARSCFLYFLISLKVGVF